MTQHIEPAIDHRAHFEIMARASGPISRHFLLRRAVKSYVRAHEKYFRACQEFAEGPSSGKDLLAYAFNAAEENMTSGGFVGGHTFNNGSALRVLAALAERNGISLEDPRFSGGTRPAPEWCKKIVAARPSSQPA